MTGELCFECADGAVAQVRMMRVFYPGFLIPREELQLHYKAFGTALDIFCLAVIFMEVLDLAQLELNRCWDDAMEYIRRIAKCSSSR